MIEQTAEKTRYGIIKKPSAFESKRLFAIVVADFQFPRGLSL